MKTATPLSSMNPLSSPARCWATWFTRGLVSAQLVSAPSRSPCCELLIDCEEDRTLRAVLVGMPQEG
jgi:hypothetical protein